MLLVSGGPLPAPVEGEGLVGSLWNLALGRSALGLFLLSIHGAPPLLGVASRNVELEEAAARAVARAVDGEIEFGDHIPPLITAHRDIAVRRLVPKYRRMDTVAWQSWGRQAVDPLRQVYLTLPECGTTGVAGAAVTLQALPNENCLVRLCVFAAGERADAVASEVSAAYQRVGVVVRPPLLKSRTLGHALEARLRWPLLQMEAKLVSLYWHPEYSAAGRTELVTAGARRRSVA